MTELRCSRIDQMIREVTGISEVTRETIEALQLQKLNEVLGREKRRQGFYKALPEHLNSLSELEGLPFTKPEELSANSGRMLLISQGEVEKIISGETSGTTGAGKRLFYTEGDLERTIRLFEAGLGEFIFPGSVTMICMPFSGPNGLGELIAEAVRRLGAEPIAAGIGKTYGELKQILEETRPDTFVGMPIALLSILRLFGPGSLKRALVSGDACPPSVIRGIEELLGSRLWPHYGSREMALGGAICCDAHEGMHLRENHVIAEIIDERGRVLPDGEFGELVITTIGMEAQPLIRYRTGDMTRILPGRCPCGSVIKRLDEVRRKDAMGMIAGLDDRMFALKGLIDYSVEQDKDIRITALTNGTDLSEEIRTLLSNEPDMAGAEITVSGRRAELSDKPMYLAKRHIIGGVAR